MTSTAARCIHDKLLSQYCQECHDSARRLVPEAPAPDAWPMRYDIQTDSQVPVTQSDWDEAQAFIRAAITVKTSLAEIDPNSSEPWKFQLAVFPNPMRLERAFIAEAKAIEPYEGLSWQGQPYFPAVPKTEWIVGGDTLVGFASEIVRRWNRVPGQY